MQLESWKNFFSWKYDSNKPHESLYFCSKANINVTRSFFKIVSYKLSSYIILRKKDQKNEFLGFKIKNFRKTSWYKGDILIFPKNLIIESLTCVVFPHFEKRKVYRSITWTLLSLSLCFFRVKIVKWIYFKRYFRLHPPNFYMCMNCICVAKGQWFHLLYFTVVQIKFCRQKTNKTQRSQLLSNLLW